MARVWSHWRAGGLVASSGGYIVLDRRLAELATPEWYSVIYQLGQPVDHLRPEAAPLTLAEVEVLGGAELPRGRRLAVDTELVIGRDAECGLHLTDGQAPRCGRVFRSSRGTAYWVETLGESPVTVNGRRVRCRAQLASGDVIHVGPLRLRFHLIAQPRAETGCC